MKPHLAYFDILRVVAAAFVVFMHTASAGLRYQVAGHMGWYLLAGASSLTFCAVPLFFMISGYLLTASDRTSDLSVLLKKRLPHLAVPLICWSILYILWSMHLNGNWNAAAFLTGLFSALQTNANPTLWFMYSLLGMYLISPVLCAGLRALDRNGALFILMLIMILKLRSVVSILFPDFYNAYLNFDVLNSLEFFSSHLSSFILGWFLGSSKRRFPQAALFSIAAITWIVITAGTIILSRSGGEYNSSFQRQNAGFEILLASCLFLLAKHARIPPEGHIMSFLHRIAPNTYPVYLMHALLLSFLYQFFSPLRFLAVLGCFSGILVVSFLLAGLLSRIPVVSYLLCGTGRKHS